jgi:hypothetical protein
LSIFDSRNRGPPFLTLHQRFDCISIVTSLISLY